MKLFILTLLALTAFSAAQNNQIKNYTLIDPPKEGMHKLTASDSTNPKFRTVLKLIINEQSLHQFQGFDHGILLKYTFEQTYEGCQSYDFYWTPYNPIYNDDSSRASNPVILSSYDAVYCNNYTPSVYLDFSQYNAGHGTLRVVHRPTGYYDETASFITTQAEYYRNDGKIPSKQVPIPSFALGHNSPKFSWCSNNNPYGISLCSNIKAKSAAKLAKNGKPACPADWAFSVAEIFETMYAISEGGIKAPVDLSVEYLVSCVNVKDDSILGTDNACQGNALDTIKVMQYISQYGFELKGTFKQKFVLGWDISTRSTDTTPKCPANFNLYNRDKRKLFSNRCIYKTKDENVAKKYLQMYGPASILVQSTGWGNGKSIVSNIKACAASGQHIRATLVGWDQDYWIVRNHEGPSWGMDGFVYIKRAENICGVLNDAIWYAPCDSPVASEPVITTSTTGSITTSTQIPNSMTSSSTTRPVNTFTTSSTRKPETSSSTTSSTKVPVISSSTSSTKSIITTTKAKIETTTYVDQDSKTTTPETTNILEYDARNSEDDDSSWISGNKILYLIPVLLFALTLTIYGLYKCYQGNSKTNDHYSKEHIETQSC